MNLIAFNLDCKKDQIAIKGYYKSGSNKFL